MHPEKIDAKVIAEACCNHMGSMKIAREMISVAAQCGAWAIKFQKRNPRECLTPARYDEPYNSENSFGDTYGEHREKLEFTVDQHAELQAYAQAKGILYACSVWDVSSFRQIALLDPPFLKIPSAHNEDSRLLETVFHEWEGDVHISNGMCGREAELRWLKAGRSRQLVLYACTSKYPAEMSDVCLLDIPRLLKDHSWGSLQAVGFSGHHNGIALDIAAVTLGASYLERHFTLNRTWKGTDQSASLEPQGLAKLVRDVKAVSEAWRERTGILPCEAGMVKKLKLFRD